MSILLVIATLITIATITAFVIIAKGTPEPTVASMLRRTNAKGDNR